MRPVPRGRRLPALFGSSSDLRSDGIELLYAGADPGGDLGAEVDGYVRATCTTAVTVDIRFRLTADRSTPVDTAFAEFGRCNSAAPCSLTRRGPAPERGGDHARRRPLVRLETA